MSLVLSSRPNYSDRVERFIDSPIRKLSTLAQEVKQKGTHVYHLNIGQPDIATSPVFLEAIKKANPPVISYSLSQGITTLRESVAHYYNTFFKTTLDKEHIMTTCGSSEALLFSFFACGDVGDEVIVPDPCYTNYMGYAQMTDIKLVSVHSYIEEAYRLPSIEVIKSKITPQTKAILICNPNNPTGYVYSKAELKNLADLCNEHNFFLIVDEAYRELVYDQPMSTSLQVLSNIKDRVIVLDTVSKKYSACGARVGFAISYNKEILNLMLRMAHMRLAPPLLAQIGSEALFGLPSSYYQEIQNIYKKRRDFALSLLRGIDGVVCPTPQGAFYLCCHLPVDDADDFCEWMLGAFRKDNKTVMITPMSGFYQDKCRGKQQIRLAYIIKEEHLTDAISCIKDALQEYNQKA